MKIYREMNLRDFKFAGGAKIPASVLTAGELDRIQEYLEEVNENWSETEINDFFWFEDDWIAIFLGYKDFDELWTERRKKR